MSEHLIQTVNRQIANWTVLYVKLHNYHWFVKGPQFFTLHELYEQLYNEAHTYIDDLAERLLALDGKPVATMGEALEIATIKEATGTETAEEMVQSTQDDFEILIDEFKDGMIIAEEAGDETTADMLLSIHQSLEKHVWMLKSFLGK
ncbi:starvation-inducible DNA-binding protein [Bacillus oleivorans]|uniref:Starvation-inducible DNA-binding protein n=1 Tax=Bacillus oleivorans TaxID=1448271 RepID=A0A285CUI6_9BACI|nr:Dps family protein [Bacillus oleivorans]SNX71230.1 starvation-inducible DNA-binding protein [Bacillus oleivorans]